MRQLQRLDSGGALTGLELWAGPLDGQGVYEVPALLLRALLVHYHYRDVATLEIALQYLFEPVPNIVVGSYAVSEGNVGDFGAPREAMDVVVTPTLLVVLHYDLYRQARHLGKDRLRYAVHVKVERRKHILLRACEVSHNSAPLDIADCGLRYRLLSTVVRRPLQMRAALDVYDHLSSHEFVDALGYFLGVGLIGGLGVLTLCGTLAPLPTTAS